MSKQRGTTRRAISIKDPVEARLRGHVEAGGSASCSRFVEDLLVETYPDVFGENAPPPAPLTAGEKAQKRERQARARARVDEQRGAAFFGSDKPAEAKTTKKDESLSVVVTDRTPFTTTTPAEAPVELSEDVEPEHSEKQPVQRRAVERTRPPKHLQPDPDPDLKPPDDDNSGMPPSIVFF